MWQAKQEFISKNNLVIIRLFDNWDARTANGQLRGLSPAFAWDSFHLPAGSEDPHEGGGEAGMDECARWLQTFVTEVPIKSIPSGDPFLDPSLETNCVLRKER